MHWNHWIRQSHRWLSIVFTLTVVANFVVRTQGEPPAWITYSPLPPLFLMLFSGLYMFVLPYVSRRTSGKRSSNNPPSPQRSLPASSTSDAKPTT